jgi:hypothetical protein
LKVIEVDECPAHAREIGWKKFMENIIKLIDKIKTYPSA